MLGVANTKLQKERCMSTVTVIHFNITLMIIDSSMRQNISEDMLLLSLSPVCLFANPWTAALRVSLSFTVSWSLFKLMFIELMMLSDHLNLCHLLPLLPIFPSIRVFSNESVICIRWPKYWSFSISPSNEYSGLISCMMDWFDLCYPRTLERLLQHQSSKASILQHSAFFNGPTLTSIHD